MTNVLISVCGSGFTPEEIDKYKIFQGTLHLSVDDGSVHDVPTSGGKSTVGKAALWNRSLKYFQDHPEFDAILILDKSAVPKRGGILAQLEEACDEVKKPFMSLGFLEMPIYAASKWTLYKRDAHNMGIYLRREAFDKVGFVNNTPRFHTLYLQRLMRTYGFSPTFLPAFRYCEFYFDMPEYVKPEDSRFEKLATDIWNGYGLMESNPGLPKKGEYVTT